MHLPFAFSRRLITIVVSNILGIVIIEVAQSSSCSLLTIDKVKGVSAKVVPYKKGHYTSSILSTEVAQNKLKLSYNRQCLRSIH